MSPPRPSEPTTYAVVIRGPLSCAEVPALCERIRAAVAAAGAEVILCDVAALPADALTVDVLARLELTARRLGRRLRLRNSTRELEELIDFMGLAGIVASETLRVEARREPEEREQAVRVEERVQPDDPIA